MMITQKKHNIEIEKSANIIVKIGESSPHTSKLRIEDRSSDRISAHSTPIRSEAGSSISQDGPDSPDYRAFPLTQDENIEVTWDWHSSVRKDNDSSKKSGDMTTPKRAIRRRKRPPSSPLVYKAPTRKQLIKKENTDGIEKFRAEMIALAQKIKSSSNNVTSTVANPKTNETDDMERKRDDFNDNESDIIVIFDDDDHDAATQKNQDSKNVDDLFNDSMDEAIIRFSQETEKKLSISSISNDDNTNGSIDKHCNDQVAASTTSQTSNYLLNSSNGVKSSNTVSTKKVNESRNVSKSTQHASNKLKPINSGVANTKQPSSSMSKIRTPKRQSTNSKMNDPDLFIPDDSFDDFVATCEPDISSSNIPLTNIKTEPKDSILNKSSTQKPSTFLPKMPSKFLSIPTSNISRNNTDNLIASQKPIPQSQIMVKKEVNQVSSTPTREFKFFKSKSHSDSNFSVKSDNSGIDYNNSRTGSSSNLTSGSSSRFDMKRGNRAVGGKIVSTNQQPVQQRTWTNSNLQTNVPKKNSDFLRKDNLPNFSRSRERGDANISRKSNEENLQRQSSNIITSGMQSMRIQCTPQEIERKRLEALKKLEARKKRIQAKNISPNSNSCPQMSVER